MAELDEGAEQGFHLQRKRLVKPGTGRPEILPLGASHAPAQEARLPRTWPASKDLKKAHASDRRLLRRRMPRCAESCVQSRRGLGSDGPPRLNPREHAPAYGPLAGETHEHNADAPSAPKARRGPQSRDCLQHVEQRADAHSYELSYPPRGLMLKNKWRPTQVQSLQLTVDRRRGDGRLQDWARTPHECDKSWKREAQRGT